MKKIIILANYGMGLYKFRKELIIELIDSGYEVYISLPNDEYVAKLEDLGCKYIATELDRRGMNPFDDLRLLLFYIQTIKKIQPDLILTYTIKPNIYGGIAARITRTTYLANITGLGTAIMNDGLLQKISLGLYKIALKGARTVFFQNTANRQFFLDKKIIKRNKSMLLPGSGVNIDEYSLIDYPEEKSDGEIHLLFIGRIMRDKGIGELLSAIQIIKDKGYNIVLDIVGFIEEADLEEKIASMAKEKTINFHGQKENVRDFIARSHAVILPSYHEGTSNVLLEAAASARPVLASNIPGCRETFDYGVSGLAFEPRDITSLADAIEKFIQLPYNEKVKMGRAGREKIEQEFNRQKVVDIYMKEISKVLTNTN